VLQPVYRDLVTAINNADTVITLVVPSTIIVVCNVRISIALSLFYRSIEASGLRRSSSSLCATVNLPPPNCRSRGRGLIHADVDRRRSWPAQNSANIYSNSSYNRLQMKVSLFVRLSAAFGLSSVSSLRFVERFITN